MPRFDGTGPMGAGPMTGRGLGYCALPLPGAGYAIPPYGYANYPVVSMGMWNPAFYAAPWVPRFGMGFGRGRGRGRGFGRGFGMGSGRNRWFYGY